MPEFNTIASSPYFISVSIDPIVKYNIGSPDLDQSSEAGSNNSLRGLRLYIQAAESDSQWSNNDKNTSALVNLDTDEILEAIKNLPVFFNDGSDRVEIKWRKYEGCSNGEPVTYIMAGSQAIFDEAQ